MKVARSGSIGEIGRLGGVAAEGDACRKERRGALRSIVAQDLDFVSLSVDLSVKGVSDLVRSFLEKI